MGRGVFRRASVPAMEIGMLRSAPVKYPPTLPVKT